MGKNDLSAANTTASVQVLGVGTDTGCSVPSVLLFFDRQRFLFNVGEGFQRFCVEHRVKLAKVSAVLATRTTTEATGGLPGMLLTMADTSCGGLLAGHAGMTVYGPPGLNTLVNAFRTFVNVKDVGLQVNEFGAASASEPLVKSELVSITPVTLTATPPSGSAVTDGVNSAEPEAKRQRVEGCNGGAEQQPAAGGMDIASVAVEGPAACYVCELPDVPGKFLPQKAASLGVPRGPLYGRLVRGETVTAANGQVVRPEDVMEPATPGPVVLVVDCPSAAFLPALTAAPLLSECATGAKRDRVTTVVHLSPLEVLRLPAYKQWLASFGDNATHVLVSESLTTPTPVMRKSAIVQAKLNLVDAGLFPLHVGPPGEEQAVELPSNCVVGSNMLRYHLRPLAKKGLDTAEVPQAVDVAAVQTELRAEKPDVLASIEASRAAQAAGGEDAPACVAAGRRDEFEVTFLGTGAAIPSKYRNVTGIHVNLFDRGGLLMDCGEGSYGQLKRRFGAHAADDLVRALRCIWISHIHADHHVGLPALLAARTRLLGPDCPPLLVLGPRPLRRALQAYAQLEPMRFRFVEASATAGPPPAGAPQPPPPTLEAQAAIADVMAGMGLSRFESVLVAHCAHAYGLVLERAAAEDGAGGWKLVFSGDTRPCPQLVEAAGGATLLIHEATFEDSLLEEAQAKKHCTTREAVESGAQAGAFRTLLTHFSQRYPKIPVVDENFQGNVGIAFDLMSVNLADVGRLPSIVPALKLLFAEEEVRPGGPTLLQLPSTRQRVLQRPATRSVASAAAHSPPPPPGEAARRVNVLFRRPAPLLTLERAVGEKHGVDGNLWDSCHFGAQVYPDLPLASTWRDLLRRSVLTAGRASEPGSVDPPPTACPAERWTVRTVAAQLRSRDQLRSMMLSAAGVGPDGEPRPGAARADALLFVSGSHPARRLPGAGRWLQNSFDLLLLASAMREEGYLPAALSLWAVENPMLAPVDRLQQKADAGAEVVLTQPPLLWERTAAWAEQAAARRVSEHVKVVLGLPVVPSVGNLDFWLRLCGVRGMPEAAALLRSFPQADDVADKAAHAAAVRQWNADLIRRSLSLPGVAGLHVMPLTKSARQLTLEFLADGTLPSSGAPLPSTS